MYVDNADFADLFRQQCERAVQTVGLEYRSDVLWERYVEYCGSIFSNILKY